MPFGDYHERRRHDKREGIDRLTTTIKGEFFRRIVSTEQRLEYRAIKPDWTKQLESVARALSPTSDMKQRLHLRTFQIGAAPKRGEGLRIGTTRRPPRGVPRDRWQRDGYFDVWFPVVAPSAALLERTRSKDFENPAVRRRFFEAYRRELQRPPAKHGVAMLAALAQRTAIAIGCFCEDESWCHRSILRREIMRAGQA